MPAASVLVRASPQPSGRACDQKEQPSARGRLRAADVCDVVFAARNHNRKAPTSCQSLCDRTRRKALRDEQQQKAAAGCGDSIWNCKFKIQYSKFRIRQLYWACLRLLPIRGAACGGRQRHQGAAGLRRPPPGCIPHGLSKAEVPLCRFNLRPRAAACEAPAQADAKADARSGPSRGEAAARCALWAQI